MLREMLREMSEIKVCFLLCTLCCEIAEGVTRVLQGCYKGVTRVLQECYKSITRVLQGCYKGYLLKHSAACAPLALPVLRRGIETL
jgi:hypothetical protein